MTTPKTLPAVDLSGVRSKKIVWCSMKCAPLDGTVIMGRTIEKYEKMYFEDGYFRSAGNGKKLVWRPIAWRPVR